MNGLSRSALSHEQTNRKRQYQVCLCSVNRLQSGGEIASEKRGYRKLSRCLDRGRGEDLSGERDGDLVLDASGFLPARSQRE
jgi:hypothetical protein